MGGEKKEKSYEETNIETAQGQEGTEPNWK
jgi:hypothetical protein